ncbi:hypothetical protein ABZP36_015005 [Zizania latifolia]
MEKRRPVLELDGYEAATGAGAGRKGGVRPDRIRTKRRPPPAPESDGTPQPTPTGKRRTPGWSCPGRPAPEPDGRRRLLLL